ncbi:MAG TPA: Uma2 family endonuclease [Umezawaea sp.]|nr:Uma2 family endonuclease [Umezawaea sp.]
MTALPHEHPLPNGISHLLTVAEYSRLGETESGYTELQEGRLVMSPSPALEHNSASLELAIQLRAQLPDELMVIQDIDVDLELVPPGEPGFSRRPDLTIIERAARERVKAEGGLLRASEVLVVVEIVSPGSRRTDYVIKRGEYADAGIPHYWIVDITTPVSLVDCHLAGEFGYQEAPAVVAEFVTTEPCPITVHVDEL